MIGHALHPTSMYIYTYVLRISITTLYSCACGGGSLHHQFCMDYIPPNADKWTDTSNFGCKWYSIYIPGSYEDDDIAADDDYYYEYYEGHDRCTEFGDHNTSPDGYTAMTACCACEAASTATRVSIRLISLMRWVRAAIITAPIQFMIPMMRLRTVIAWSLVMIFRMPMV